MTPWAVVCQAPLSMGFSRQEYWSGLPCLPPGDLPNPGIKPASLRSPALADGFLATSANWEAPHSLDKCNSKYSEYHITLARKAVVKKSTSNKCWSVWRKWTLLPQCAVDGNANWYRHYIEECVCARVLLPQSCLTLCDPVDCSPPGSFVHGILRIRILQWVAMRSSRASSQPRDWTCISYVSCAGKRVLYHWCHLGSPREQKWRFLKKARNKTTIWPNNPTTVRSCTLRKP